MNPLQSEETRIRKKQSATLTQKNPITPSPGSGLEEIHIGNYKVLEEIGRGGMGVVYLGEQVSLKRQVAIKTLPLEMAHDGEFLQRIENEAKILAKFSNPNIVYIHDRVTQDDAIYLIMEYVPGITVADRLREDGPYELNEAARIIIRVAVALEHAHSKGIIHRDIKPSNIMIRSDNVVKVTDFGIAKSSEGSDITRMRFTPGTRDYMSPEQARGLRDIDGRSDIYSLGVVFYLMLTGKLPPYPVPNRLPFVSPLYEKIILKCLAEDRSQRYQSSKDLIYAMDQAKEESARRKKAKPAGQKKFPKGVPLLMGALLVVLMAVLSIWQMGNIIAFFNGPPEKPVIDESKVVATSRQDSQGDAVVPQDRQPADKTSISQPANGALNAEPAGDRDPAAPLEQTVSLPLPVLRPAADRTAEILAAIGDRQGLGLQSNPRMIFALKTAVLDPAGDNPALAVSLKAWLDQMDVVRSVQQGGCDLLVVMDAISQNVALSSNLYGDDRVEAYKERFSFQDDQELFTRIETFIRKYYCFNLLASMKLLAPVDAGFTPNITLKGEAFGEIQAGRTIDICLNANHEGYSIMLSVNAEGIYMLFPQTREENVPLTFRKPLCTGPIEVSPPTGAEMIAAILYIDKALLPVDGYLGAEDQVIIEPASWSYAPYSSTSAVDYCEHLFTSLQAAPSDQYSVSSKFIRTYD